MMDITLKEATDQYLEYLKTRGHSDRTLYTYGKDVGQILTFFGPERLLEGIMNTHVGKFYRSDALLRLPDGRERARQTVNKTVRVLRMFFLWTVEQGYISEAPLPKSTPMGSQKKRGGHTP